MNIKLGFILIVVGGAAFAFWMGGGRNAPPDEVFRPQEPAPTVAEPIVTSVVSTPPSPTPSAPPSKEPPRPVFTSSVIPGTVVTTTSPVPAPSPTSAPAVASRPPGQEDPAIAEAESLALNIRHFGQRFGGNPVGTNAEIVKALTGGNPKRATYLPSDLIRLNENGELVDRWGTPYFFHANSATDMEVRSAGPDKRLYTEDDIVQN